MGLFCAWVETGNEVQGGNWLQMGHPEDSKTHCQGKQQLALTSLANENIFQVWQTFLLMSSKAFCQKTKSVF